MTPPRLPLLLLVPFLALFPLSSSLADDTPLVPERLIRDQLLNPWTGDLDGMLKRRFIRVLVVYNKTNYFLDGAEEKGITAELARSCEKWLNGKLKTGKFPAQFVMIPVARDELLPFLEQGKGDIAAAGLTVTPERRERVRFAKPWGTGVKEIVVAGPASPRLDRLDDLAGKEVYIVRSSSYFASLTRLNEDFRTRGLEPARIREASENLESEDLMEMVNAGLLPLTVIDEYRARFWAKVLKDVEVRSDLAVATDGEIAWAVRKDSPKLLASLNEFVAKEKGGSDLSYLAHKYFDNTRFVTNPHSTDDWRRFKAAEKYFKRYAGEYGFDYLLVAAQAYQESRIDQNRVSPAGAVGVMQLLPSTAAGPPINIRNIDSLESNIKAGVKYLHHLVVDYFSDPGIDELNRLLFAFAAYNAGPGNMRAARRKAREMGLDPNRWFNNVENAMAREVGREPVHYVSSIFKYYIAYRLAREREQERVEALEKHFSVGQEETFR